MKKNTYLVSYSSKDLHYEEPFNTLEVILFLILSKFNKRVELYSVVYNSFLSN